MRKKDKSDRRDIKDEDKEDRSGTGVGRVPCRKSEREKIIQEIYKLIKRTSRQNYTSRVKRVVKL